MIRKILTLFLLCLLFTGCSEEKKEEENIPQETIDYIDPVKDVFIFGELKEDLKYKIKKANCNADFANYQFKMLGKPAYEGIVKDINDNDVDLGQLKDFYLEVVSVECSHCKKQLPLMVNLAKDAEYPFVQYFNVGTREEVLSLYEEEGLSIPENMIVLCRDENLKDFIKENLALKSYPTLLTYKDGKVTFDAVGEINEDSFAMLNTLGFEEAIDVNTLKDKYGNDLLSISRSIDDLKNDLSKENREKLEALDNDDYTAQLTYQLMGKRADLETINTPQGDHFYSEVDDFSIYENEKLVLLYTYLRDNSETEKVEFINDLMKQESDEKYIVILVEGLESSSFALKNMSVRFNCPVVSVLGRMPEDFFNFGLANYPTAVFLDKGTFTGAYSNIESKEKYTEALGIFLGDQCIAYKSNN